MKVLITDKINESAASVLKGVCEIDFLPTMSEDELCKIIGDYDALMVRSQTKVTAKIIEAGKKLKIIGRAGVGVDNVDIESATQHGKIVVNSPDGNTMAAAEHTLALMLSMARNIPQACEVTKQGIWDRAKFTGCEVYHKTLGVIGLGKIGSHVAKVAIALGMNVVVYDPYTSKEVIEKLGATQVASLDEFWAQGDFITIHTPKTKETAYLINKNTINRMKKGVKIINCARGGIIDEVALKEAIESGQVSSAAIDVFEDEPNIDKSPLIHVKGNIVLTPHLGASTCEAQFNVAIDVAEQIKEVLTGGSARSAVNIPALKPEKVEPVKDYMQLSEYLGEIAQQISTGAIKSIEIVVKGKPAEFDVAPIEIAVLKGVFSSFIENINYVNAPIIAKSRGVEVITSRSELDCTYIGSVTVIIKTDKEETSVAGALIAQNIRRIVKINEYNTSIKPETHMILVPHENKPAMIAKVATVIGENNININRMQVSQKSGELDNTGDHISIMIINTEQEVGESTLEKISKIDGVQNAKYINLTSKLA